MGQIINRNCRRLDLAQARAIKDMPTPKNVSTQQSFLGLTNYYNVFVPNMHCLRALLNKLWKKDSK